MSEGDSFSISFISDEVNQVSMSNQQDEANLSYDELLAKYKNQLKEINEQTWNLKKNVILNLAKKLEESGTPKDMISAKITEDLKDCDISDRYIREVLGREFTQKSKRREKIAANLPQKPVIEITNEGTTTTTIPSISKDDLSELERLRLENAELKEIESKR